MTNASIVTIGDEILIGQILDTNSSAISRELGKKGVRTVRMLSIGDDHPTIVKTLGNELENADIVIVTGGLGPTKDDITKKALAELYGSPGMVEHPGQLEMVRKILASRGLDMLDINRAQALVPTGCEVIVNRKGTAPVMVFRFSGERFGHTATLYSLPGVPFEAEGALPDVVADICAHYPLEHIHHRTFMTYGIAESALSKLIEPWELSLPPDMHLAYLPNPLTGVRLRISVYGGDPEEAERKISAEMARIRPILGDYLYSETDDTLQHRIGQILAEKGQTLSVAESCTGGTISQLITSVPGSSGYYLGSVTSYAVSIKEKVLGVPADTIREFGVVSAEVAAAMAEGVRRLTGSDWAVATTGLASAATAPTSSKPSGEKEQRRAGITELESSAESIVSAAQQPVGTVWIAVSSARGTVTESYVYKNDRKRNIERFAASALNLLRLELEKTK